MAATSPPEDPFDPLPVLVVGGGPAGLSCALELSRRGRAVEVFESEPRVGGLSRSFDLWGHRVDLGPHRFFTADSRVSSLWRSTLDGQLHEVHRLTRILFERRFYAYPLKAGNALWNMGLLRATGCLASYLAEQLRPAMRPAASFEEWVVRRFGRRLYEMFFKGYSEKLWGIPCTELDVDFAAQRIRKFSLGKAIWSALGARGRHKTLVDLFDYPDGGAGSPYERMALEIRRRGGRIHEGKSVAQVLVESGRATGIELADGTLVRGGHVVSTMPLTTMVERLPDLPDPVRHACVELRYRNTILVYLRLQAMAVFPDQWLYVHSPELRFGRLTNFENWGGRDRHEDTVVALEYWCDDDDPLWNDDDEELVRLAGRDLAGTGLIDGVPLLEGHVERLHRSYPVYRCGYGRHVDVIRSHLLTIDGLQAIGRNGSFKYNNQDHSILMGILAAERISEGAEHDLWAVNSDFDEYQEGGRKAGAGLPESS